MVFKDTMNGNCHTCEFYKDDQCKRVEKAFSTMIDPVCLQKVQCILLRDLVQVMNEYLYEDEE